MKKWIFTVLSCGALSLLQAQEKPAFVTSSLFGKDSDIEWILQDHKVYTYGVDLQPVKGKEYKLKIYVDEYHGRDSVKQLRNFASETVRNFPEHNIYHQAEKLRTMFRLNTDSTAVISLSIPNFFGLQHPVKLEKVQDFYGYNARPFAVTDFEIDKKIPVVLYGSVWYDEKYNICRFCGLKELPVDMEDEMFSLMPHYFIISLKVEELKK